MPAVGRIDVPVAEAGRLGELLAGLADRHTRADDPEFLRALPRLGGQLPAAVRTGLLDLRYLETAAAIVIGGGPELPDPGPTPASWQAIDSAALIRHDMWLLLLAGQLGEPLCWSVWQDGHLINDILPVSGAEDEQTGLGSSAELEFHVEEALYDDRCDYLLLHCLRNDDGVATTFSAVDDLDLAALDLDVLFEPRYRIGDHSGPARPALFGSPESPYLRLDPPYMTPLDGDARAARALDSLVDQLARNAVDVVLAAGDVLVIDNYRAVHGRRPFRARYDGTDRWLRRCTTARDLRPTRAGRDGAEGRVVDPELIMPA
jgi:hypothetical protein